MKKIVFLSLFTLCLPLAMVAQSNDDDLYFIPSKDKDKEVKAPAKKAPAKREVTTIYTAPGSTVVIQDRKGNTRDVDEYNRRYDARDNDFVMEDDTLYIKEKAQRGLDGEWVNGEFNGSQDDYEYAERIIRFRNPRYAISISSPFYWDVVYGANSWDWNVYTDGLYAYAFPTFSNRLWWDWRFNSFGGGWGWGSPYYGYGWGGYPGYWGGYYGGYWGGGYWGGGWGHHHHYPGYYPGWGGGGHWASNRNTYTNRTYSGRSDYGNSSSARRYGSNGSVRSDRSTGTSSYTRGDQNSARRIIGTRNVGERNGISTRTDGSSSSRNSIYTRPSSTRGNSSIETSRNNGSVSTPGYSEGGRRASSRSSSTYSRGSSTAPERSSSAESSRRSYTPERSSSSSSRSYSSPSGSSSRSYSTGGGGGGSSSRSSGGGGGSSRSRR